MSFLQPALLLGLLGLAGVFLAHLLGRERPTRVPFAAMRFLPATPQAVVRRRTLRDRNLLIVRLALLGAIVLALARPVTRGESTLSVIGEPHDAILLIDTSASMELVVEDETLRARARQRALELLRALPPGSRVGLMVSTGEGADRPLVPLGDDPGAIEAAIEARGLLPSHGSGTLADALAAAVGAVTASEGERTRAIYAIGDRTRGGVASLPPRLGDVIVVPVPVHDGVRPPAHVGIETVALEPAPELDPSAVRISATIAWYDGDDTGPADGSELDASDAAKETLEVGARLVVDEREVARASVAVTRGDRATLEFTHTPDSALADVASAAVVELIDRDQDAWPVDDRRWRWLASRGALDVLVVNGDPSDRRTHDEVYFLATAMASLPDSHTRFAVRGMAPEQLAARIAEDENALGGVGVLLMANVEAPDERTATAIERAVGRGMGLWIGVGNRVTGREYNQRFSTILPLRMREAQDVGTAIGRKDARAEGLSPPRLDHPMFEGLTTAPEIEGARIRRRFLLQPDPKRDADVVIAFESGAPLLVTRAHGEGRVALLSTTLDRDWSDLALRPGFVALVERTLGWVGGARASAAPRVFAVGDSVPLPDEDLGNMIVHGPESETWTLAEARFDSVHGPGLYRVERPGVTGEPIARFAADVDPREAPTRWASSTQVAATDGARSVVSLTPRWRWFVVVALLLLIAESTWRIARLRR